MCHVCLCGSIFCTSQPVSQSITLSDSGDLWPFRLDKPARLMIRFVIGICIWLWDECHNPLRAAAEKYWPQKLSFRPHTLLKTIISPHVPLNFTPMISCSLQFHSNPSKTANQFNSRCLPCRFGGSISQFLSFRICFHWNLVWFVRPGLVVSGKVFLLISFHICSHREENGTSFIQNCTNCNRQNVCNSKEILFTPNLFAL